MNKSFVLILIFCLATGLSALAQNYSISNDESKLSVFGSSTLHDWKLNAGKIIGHAQFDFDGKELKNIKSLNIEIPVAHLSSGLDALDNHMQKAMTANNATVVTFILSKVTSLTSNSIGGYTVQADGKISIIKNTNPVSLQGTIQLNDDGSIRIFGETEMSMTDYEVEPPQAEMGSIQTENNVKVVFDVVFKK